MISYLDEYRGKFGVEPICQTLREAGVEIAPSTYYATKKRMPSARTQRDEALKAKITSAHEANRGVYGAVKLWHLLQQQGETVARCTVERLMGELDLAGAVRGKRRITTLQVKDAELAADLVQRKFEATAPDRLWVSDFTYILARSGTLYTAFTIDVFSRRIVGWKVSRRPRAPVAPICPQMGSFAGASSRHLRTDGSFKGAGRARLRPDGPFTGAGRVRLPHRRVLHRCR